MFVKQIDLNEALKLAAKGREVKVLMPPPDGDWEDMCPTTMGKMLGSCLFFRAEPAMESSELKGALQGDQSPHDTDGAAAGAAGSTAKPPGKRVGAGGRRKQKTVDTGKFLALHNAGWSNVKIAEEIGISEVTIYSYLKKMEEDKSGEKDKVQ